MKRKRTQTSWDMDDKIRFAASAAMVCFTDELKKRGFVHIQGVHYRAPDGSEWDIWNTTDWNPR